MNIFHPKIKEYQPLTTPLNLWPFNVDEYFRVRGTGFTDFEHFKMLELTTRCLINILPTFMRNF